MVKKFIKPLLIIIAIIMLILTVLLIIETIHLQDTLIANPAEPTDQLKRYFSTYVSDCDRVRFSCLQNETPFFDQTGCGCLRNRDDVQYSSLIKS